MKSFSTITIKSSVVTIGLTMLLTQVAVAQSGSRNNAVPSRQAPPATSQNLIPVQPNSGWRAETRRSEPRPEPQPQPRATSRAGFEQYDHRVWDNLLQKYVDRDGNVDYTSWQTNQQDRAALLNYLLGMSAVDTSLGSNRQSEMAFWINAYNALTIEGILQVFPTKSIKDHAPDANGFNIWDDFKLPVAGNEYSLNDIEHQILRKMGDPRIHFAIVCASKGCPQLLQRAYFAESLDQQLTYGATLFFHTQGKFGYDLQQRQIALSPIIQWFGEDFGRTDAERLQYLAQFMPQDAARLAANGSPTISYLEYDWSLNLAPPKSTVQPTATLRPELETQGRCGGGRCKSQPCHDLTANRR